MLFLIIPASYGQQVDNFLACGEITDRVERVLCLETALEQSVSATQEQSEEVSTAVIDARENVESSETVESFGRTDESADVSIADEEADGGGFRLPVIGNIFGRNRDVAVDQKVEVDEEPASDRLENFGRGTTSKVVENAEGEEELFDTVTELVMAKPNMWLIRLASGQVWRQTHVRRFNLREGDEVRIYPTNWGENYRLETQRLSGFIQLERIQ